MVSVRIVGILLLTLVCLFFVCMSWGIAQFTLWSDVLLLHLCLCEWGLSLMTQVGQLNCSTTTLPLSHLFLALSSPSFPLSLSLPCLCVFPALPLYLSLSSSLSLQGRKQIWHLNEGLGFIIEWAQALKRQTDCAVNHSSTDYNLHPRCSDHCRVTYCAFCLSTHQQSNCLSINARVLILNRLCIMQYIAYIQGRYVLHQHYW